MRTYTEQQKSEAIGLALVIGARQAALQLGIPHRNVARWVASPGALPAIAASREDVAARLWQGINEGTEALLVGLRDPKQRLGEKASALRVLMESHQLLTGGSTANIASNVAYNGPPPLTEDERRELADWLDQNDWYGRRTVAEEETSDA